MSQPIIMSSEAHPSGPAGTKGTNLPKTPNAKRSVMRRFQSSCQPRDILQIG